jgi:23S rRNA (adenine1618-N6)-methyltransferase
MNNSTGEKPLQRLHSRNRNRANYDLQALIGVKPELSQYLKQNKFNGAETIDFSNPQAVRLLNQAILSHYYQIKYWDFPQENLCPPIPGRADYIHQMADFLATSNGGVIPKGHHIRCFDIGLGASCIFPIIGAVEYEWSFVGSDTDPKSIASAKKIVEANSCLSDKVECRLQNNPSAIFDSVMGIEEKFDMVICNPPFHATQAEAEQGTRRKIKNLSGQKSNLIKLNFSGNHNELIFKGGEVKFISNIIEESKKYSTNSLWFSSLVSKEEHLENIKKILFNAGVHEFKIIPLNTANKTSRIIVWTYLNEKEQSLWVEKRWP